MIRGFRFPTTSSDHLIFKNFQKKFLTNPKQIFKISKNLIFL